MPPSLGDVVVEVLLEFIEAVIHQILFVRELYRADLFERQRLYGVAIRKARHPELCDYIHDVTTSLKEPLARGTLAKLAVVVQSQCGAQVEQFVVEPKVLQGGTLPGSHLPDDTPDLAEVEAQLRGCLVKLQYLDSYLQPPPPGCTFELVAYTSGRGGMRVQDWVEEGEQRGEGGTAEEGQGQKGAIVPIKTCRCEGAFQLELYVAGAVT